RKQAALLTTFALDVAHKRQCPHQLMEALSSACSQTARFSHSLPWRAFSFPAYEPRAAHKKARQVAGKGNKHSG
ncbi:hypothetical protein KUC67_29495, partial [Pseudomonas aeruginosa]|uniref:hypothetical protein n=1 Tax=Pseudomonas aeruginosa TaxID=287 RepID=UPI0021E10665